MGRMFGRCTFWGTIQQKVLGCERRSRNSCWSYEFTQQRSWKTSKKNLENSFCEANDFINNRVLQSVKSRMSRACKCHGMSGSCSLKVCWKRLPAFRQVGEALFQRYEGAAHVKLVEGKRRRKLRPVSHDIKKPNKTELVFLEDSPDYCEENET